MWLDTKDEKIRRDIDKKIVFAIDEMDKILLADKRAEEAEGIFGGT
mgnify:FL=1